MAKDDMAVIIYKLLKYIYGCIQAGIEPNFDKARDVSGVPNDVYWLSVVNEVVESGFVRGVEVRDYISGSAIETSHVGITLKGAQFIKENSAMVKVANALGSPFVKVIEKAVEATGLL